MPYLNDDWRPDRSGVLIDIVVGENQIPPEFPQVGLKFDVVNSPQVLSWDPLLRFIGSEIARGHPVFLSVPAPIGHDRKKVFLNYLLANAVTSRDRTLMIKELVGAFQMGINDAMTEKATFQSDEPSPKND